ncbi:src-like-adapter 2 isoform X1 [Astyanax mexicanus]|uniref:Src-like-adapter 2 isoform X1 n=1 Tax=Astyanax mexicanus TaxID=7994 RepID=A0A8T2LDH8_ASTMX|nr:src-like-adapter 2 isoform X1 [Astyanax mexicanus]
MGTWPSKGRSRRAQRAALLSQDQPTEPHTIDNGRYVVVALYDYPSGGPSEYSIRVGERLNVLSDEGEWWKVSSSSTGRESYIPSNYTAKVYNRWQFVGLGRQKSEELLLLPYNQVGSFLIRESETEEGCHTLSVLKSSRLERRSVKHYRIHRIENGWHYISPRLTFPTLAHLVEHYTEVSEGLCCLLREPCYIQGSNNVPVLSGPPPVAVRKPTLNWKDVNRSMIFGPQKEGVEESLVSEGLKEAINSYLYMTEECGECGECSGNWDT